MTQDEYLTEFELLTSKMCTLTAKKNSDYAGGEDAFRNFKLVEQMGGATVEQGLLTRITDKISRFATFVSRGTLKVEDEKIEDTLIDCAVYCLITILYLREQRHTQSQFGIGGPQDLPSISPDQNIDRRPSQGSLTRSMKRPTAPRI